ncbi:MAG: BON domain-containing protein [Candidatus Baltobacteraceae bacterium]
MMETRTLDLQEEIIEELAYDPRITADEIAVNVKEGVVTLRGRVPSLYQKWEVEDAVKRVRGVRGIADELEVSLPTTHFRTDTDLALAIERRFATGTTIPRGIQFVVKEGHVTLSGEVSWYFQAQEAASEVRRVAGVRGVANLIGVKTAPALGADEIKRRIRSALHRTAEMDAASIDVSASNGLVTLSGSVRTLLEREKASQAAWSLPGVTHVANYIAVQP